MNNTIRAYYWFKGEVLSKIPAELRKQMKPEIEKLPFKNQRILDRIGSILGLIFRDQKTENLFYASPPGEFDPEAERMLLDLLRGMKLDDRLYACYIAFALALIDFKDDDLILALQGIFTFEED